MPTTATRVDVRADVCGLMASRVLSSHDDTKTERDTKTREGQSPKTIIVSFTNRYETLCVRRATRRDVRCSSILHIGTIKTRCI